MFLLNYSNTRIVDDEHSLGRILKLGICILFHKRSKYAENFSGENDLIRAANITWGVLIKSCGCL